MIRASPTESIEILIMVTAIRALSGTAAVGQLDQRSKGCPLAKSEPPLAMPHRDSNSSVRSTRIRILNAKCLLERRRRK